MLVFLGMLFVCFSFLRQGSELLILLPQPLKYCDYTSMHTHLTLTLIFLDKSNIFHL